MQIAADQQHAVTTIEPHQFVDTLQTHAACGYCVEECAAQVDKSYANLLRMWGDV